MFGLEPDNAQYKKALDMAQVRNLKEHTVKTRSLPYTLSPVPF
jgi:hypothetical protein